MQNLAYQWPSWDELKKENLFIYLGFYIAFNTVQVISGRVVGRAEETSTQFVRALYCKLPTKGKQLPAFPLEAMMGIEPRPQRLEARVLPLCHRGPLKKDKVDLHLGLIKDDK